MRKLNWGRSTRSIYLSLACLSLALHLLLAFFCLSVLQTACVLPSSSSSPATDALNQESQSSIASAASSSHQVVPAHPPDVEHLKVNAKSSQPKENHSISGAAEKEKPLISAGKVTQTSKRQSKLEALFKHLLYNLPQPELQEDDWLLRVKQNEHSQEARRKEMEREDAIHIDSEW